MLVDTYIGQIMRFWYWLHPPPPPRDIDEGSGQTLWASSWYFCINRICEQRMLRWTCTFAQCHNSFCCSHWKKKRDVDEGSGPTLSLLWGGSVVVDSILIFLPLDCWGSVFGPCLVRHYLVFFLILQSSWRGRESMMFYFNCLPTINVLWLLLTVPWIVWLWYFLIILTCIL